MAQSVKRPTLGFSSGHDLTVHEFEPHIGVCADGAQSAWDFLPVPLCPSPAHTLSLSKIKMKKILNYLFNYFKSLFIYFE